MTPFFFKYAFRQTPKSKARSLAQKHFDAPDPNWHQFEKNLKLKTFQQVVAGHPQADEKLKTYVDNYGGYLLSKKTTARVTGDSGKTYTVKELPGGRLGCNCGNWQYRRSVDGGDCKHITSIVGNGMKKLSYYSQGMTQTHLSLIDELLNGFPKKEEPKVEPKKSKKADMVKLSFAKQAFMKDLVNAGATLALQNNRRLKGTNQARAGKAVNQAYQDSLYGDRG